MQSELVDIYTAFFIKKRKDFDKNYKDFTSPQNQIFEKMKQDKKYNKNQIKNLEFFLTLQQEEKEIYKEILYHDIKKHITQYKILCNALQNASYDIVDNLYQIKYLINSTQILLKSLPFENKADYTINIRKARKNKQKLINLLNECEVILPQQIMSILKTDKNLKNNDFYLPNKLLEDINFEAKNAMEKSIRYDQINELSGNNFISLKNLTLKNLNSIKFEEELINFTKHYPENIRKIKSNISYIDFKINQSQKEYHKTSQNVF